MIRFVRHRICVGRRDIDAGHVTREASSARQHGHSSPRSVRRRFSHGQWYLRSYRRPPQRRQMCGWNAHGGWPLRQMKRPKSNCCKQGSLRFE